MEGTADAAPAWLLSAHAADWCEYTETRHVLFRCDDDSEAASESGGDSDGGDSDDGDSDGGDSDGGDSDGDASPVYCAKSKRKRLEQRSTWRWLRRDMCLSVDLETTTTDRATQERTRQLYAVLDRMHFCSAFEARPLACVARHAAHLFARGVDMRASAGFWTPLHVAALFAGDECIGAALAAAEAQGVSVDVRAATETRIDADDYILDYRATPLAVACIQFNARAIERLLALGADPCATMDAAGRASFWSGERTTMLALECNFNHRARKNLEAGTRAEATRALFAPFRALLCPWQLAQLLAAEGDAAALETLLLDDELAQSLMKSSRHVVRGPVAEGLVLKAAMRTMQQDSILHCLLHVYGGDLFKRFIREYATEDVDNLVDTAIGAYSKECLVELVRRGATKICLEGEDVDRRERERFEDCDFYHIAETAALIRRAPIMALLE